MASGLISSWQMDGENSGNSGDTLIFWTPKSLQMVTETMKLKDTSWKKSYDQPRLDSILKSRDITLPTKVCLVKAMVFLVVVYRCESWTIKKAEHQRLMLLNCGVEEDS